MCVNGTTKSPPLLKYPGSVEEALPLKIFSARLWRLSLLLLCSNVVQIKRLSAEGGDSRNSH